MLSRVRAAVSLLTLGNKTSGEFDLKIGRKGWAEKEIAPFQFVNEK